MDTAETLDQYPAKITLPIIWGDMDALRHVNNTKHIQWFESSRIRYLEEAGLHQLMESYQLGPILAAVSCNYKRQLRYPGNVIAGTRVIRVGRSSMTLEHIIVDEEAMEIAAQGESVVVVFDYERQKPVRIPQDVRDAITAFQGPVAD